MKTLLIAALLLALIAAAAFTRPSQQSFHDYVLKERTDGASGGLMNVLSRAEAEAYVDRCTLVNRYLWVDVQADGKTLYTGAFSRWFKRSSAPRR